MAPPPLPRRLPRLCRLRLPPPPCRLCLSASTVSPMPPPRRRRLHLRGSAFCLHSVAFALRPSACIAPPPPGASPSSTSIASTPPPPVRPPRACLCLNAATASPPSPARLRWGIRCVRV
ncbi:Os07g0478766 [Oryza sativa Japonica Group]|uniref:Os07g0478766 protein n=1 Tax=Oryza sativa subsp. japonica TaxID=39947 RepID=A0A0P0X606_ORYSJ|nr:Os07g0478766 [Oryza sativa Japonica Group]